MMEKDTREKLIDVAVKLFAAKGFDGTSINDIAAELDITKQALLHHFRRKEKLYGEVLERIFAHSGAVVEKAVADADGPVAQFRAALDAMYQSMMADTDRSQVLLRELLDNQHRAPDARSWYFQPLLNRFLQLARAARPDLDLPDGVIIAFVYQNISAGHYFAVSLPTLQGVLSPGDFADMQGAYPQELNRQIDYFMSL